MQDQRNAVAAGGSAHRFGGFLRIRLLQNWLAPLIGFRWRFLPPLTIYFAYGFIGFVSVAESSWTNQTLRLPGQDLANIGFWLGVPWTIKMVFGQAVDSVSVFGSRRYGYVVLGAALVAAGLLTLAGTAGGWITMASARTLYLVGSMLVATGFVIQDVVADAMCAEVVPRVEADGTARPREQVWAELVAVQALGRVALIGGILAATYLGDRISQAFRYETVCLIGLAVPAISVAGALLVRPAAVERGPIDWSILAGGLILAGVSAAGAFGTIPFHTETLFAVSLAVVSGLLWRFSRHLDATEKQAILFAALMIFAFRSTPSFGEGWRWFSIDTLGFDQALFGELAQSGSIAAVLGTWLFAHVIARKPLKTVLIWLAMLSPLFALPSLALVLRMDLWTAHAFGVTASDIVRLESSIDARWGAVAMVAMLSFVAFHAPEGRRATWFALMASLMNLGLAASQIQTKYLNLLFGIERGQLDSLVYLCVTVLALSFLWPAAVIFGLGRRRG